VRAITDKAGHFEISAPPGEYILTVSAEAFRVSIKKPVQIIAAAPTVEHIQLTIESDICSPCIASSEKPLILLDEPFDMLLSLNPLPTYKFPARTSKHLHI
jgi:hypothetical protein